jgi:hypothetical protein
MVVDADRSTNDHTLNTITALNITALKGQNNLAQGIALGTRQTGIRQALKGRHRRWTLQPGACCLVSAL